MSVPHDFIHKNIEYYTGVFNDIACYDLIFCRKCGFVVQDRYNSTKDAPRSCIEDTREEDKK